ncbi:hypothetical protein A4X09_0g4235 [Tilletia walkeri]|uniref:MPN domain-containing protein n=1 Tax=Tilletia walkeri TaxID=117179 RepID=A0A8X7N7J4_9BASI|nr:hypothetical protein A4X09_0g4235 [Tilletia walkeri]
MTDKQQRTFHLPIPSVFRAKKAAPTAETRPATIKELADAATTHADTIFNTAIPIHRLLAGAHGLRTQADSYLQAADYEHAFICLAKAARLLVDLIPNKHPAWKSDLSLQQRNKVKQDAQAVLDKISECKPILIDNYDKWKAAHPKIKDIDSIPTAISIPPPQAEEQEPPPPQPEESSSSSSYQQSTLTRRKPERPTTESFDVRSILGYDAAPPTIANNASSSSRSSSTSTTSITYSNTLPPSSIPYAASTQSSLEPWAASSSSSSSQQDRFAYPILRRSSTQKSSNSYAASSKRQQTADSISMTPDQSGQGFAPRTALGESYYMTLPPVSARQQQAFPWSATPPPSQPLLPPATSTPSTGSTSAPNTPLQGRPPAVLGPRPIGGSAQPGPPRPAKSLTQISIPQPPQPPALHQSVPSLPQRAPTADFDNLSITTSGPALYTNDPDGGGSRLERHATQLLTLGRHSAPPPSTSTSTSGPSPALPQRQRPPRPQRSATEEEEAQLAWALEASRKEMEELERKAAAAAASARGSIISSRATAPPASTPSMNGNMDAGAIAFTEGGTPLRTVILPTRVLSIFLALARENTENDIETCALLMGKLRTSESAFVVTHLTVPAQSGGSDRCETHDEEAIWAFQEEHDLVTVGWIHTHPTQNPHGVQTIMHCRAPGLFHPHVSETGDDIPALYTDALHGHVRLDPEAKLMVVDLR